MGSCEGISARSRLLPLPALPSKRGSNACGHGSSHRRANAEQRPRSERLDKSRQPRQPVRPMSQEGARLDTSSDKTRAGLRPRRQPNLSRWLTHKHNTAQHSSRRLRKHQLNTTACPPSQNLGLLGRAPTPGAKLMRVPSFETGWSCGKPKSMRKFFDFG